MQQITTKAAMRGHIILSHGLDSSPEATKVSVLAKCAEALGWQTIRPDYRADDALGHAGCVEPRLRRLQAAIEACPAAPVLVGSSMGAFVSGLVATRVRVAALFLLAVPSAIPGVDTPFDLPADLPTMLVHGWRDELCPADRLVEMARARRLPLLMLDDDHRLSGSVEAIATQFGLFLENLAEAA